MIVSAVVQTKSLKEDLENLLPSIIALTPNLIKVFSIYSN